MLLSPRRPDRGQGSLEMVGVIILASILVLATTGAIVQTSPQLKSEVSYRICQILNFAGGGSCEAPGEAEVPSPEDRLPDDPCLAGSTSTEASVGGSFTFFTGNAGKKYMVEEMSDGSFKVTEVDSGGLGVTAGVGAENTVTIDGVDYGYGASADASALLAGEKGNTWYAKDQDELDDLMSTMTKGKVVDAVAPKKILGLVPNPINSVAKDLVGGDLPDPDEQFIEGGIEGEAGASATAIVAGAGADVSLGGYLGGKKTPDGYTAYYRTELEGSAFGTLLVAEGQLNGKVDGLIEINTDSSGKPTSVKVTSGIAGKADIQYTTEGDADQYTEVTVEIPLTGDVTEDARVLAMLGNPLTADDFVREAQERGTVTRSVFEDDSNTYGYSGEAGLGPKIGIDISGDLTTRDLQEAQYWDGTRMADRPDC
ncbi:MULTISPECIES: hypothetical protein [unclassified Aeromicrobium]|uniref:hypothetical protein n=1 Tax=unclassified Aeromicrobium TaxID=2633570 RepID=UPI0006FC39DF|nr:MULTISPECIES: hypothetical protein [unclassified Aeromicrobium]KQO41759.1 hypothetical protein ASF05_11610 [Aeromicrobium sp. Leaf245]KQP27092.1 hypothetical protein ASF38_04730 [Aeromicrobium sp. Leaf272]KQP77112.1 hypothetical protein ASF37_11055 [Aeromicrobium sp. Leaf289]KQP81145.1 hypothetical protein ASF35_13715 [Aeromicrobium sp. Leaf291]